MGEGRYGEKGEKGIDGENRDMERGESDRWGNMGRYGEKEEIWGEGVYRGRGEIWG